MSVDSWVPTDPYRCQFCHVSRRVDRKVNDDDEKSILNKQLRSTDFDMKKCSKTQVHLPITPARSSARSRARSKTNSIHKWTGKEKNNDDGNEIQLPVEKHQIEHANIYQIN